MSAQSMVSVPEGMSCVNAFHAIWKVSKPVAFLRLYPQLADRYAEAVSTAKKVAALFREHTLFETVGGKAMGVDFSQFPLIVCKTSDQEVVLQALTKYNRIAPKDRFDPMDNYKFTELTGARIVSRL